MDYNKLIKKIKPLRLAKLMNIPATTVYSWKYSGIPYWRVPAVMKACKELGVDISDCLEREA